MSLKVCIVIYDLLYRFASAGVSSPMLRPPNEFDDEGLCYFLCNAKLSILYRLFFIQNIFFSNIKPTAD